MSVIIFVWDMFKYRPGDGVGVGHASLYIHGNSGSIYVSYWPAKHSVRAALGSPAKVHFMSGDKLADGNPDWASKTLQNLDEEGMIGWWKRIQPDCMLNYEHRTSFMQQGVEEAATGSEYNIVKNQCSTTVVNCLLAGSDAKLAASIRAWKTLHCPITVTPSQVKTLIEDIF